MRRPGKVCIGFLSRTLCSVCSPSMGRCYVAHRRRPYNWSVATFDVAPPTARNICLGCYLGALLACGRRLPCLPASPQRRQTPAAPDARRRTNALTLCPFGSLPKPALPFRSRCWSLAAPRFPHAGASLVPRFPSLRGSCSLRSHSPRHAYPRPVRAH